MAADELFATLLSLCRHRFFGYDGSCRMSWSGIAPERDQAAHDSNERQARFYRHAPVGAIVPAIPDAPRFSRANLPRFRKETEDEPDQAVRPTMIWVWMFVRYHVSGSALWGMLSELHHESERNERADV